MLKWMASSIAAFAAAFYTKVLSLFPAVIASVAPAYPAG
jgi:hypothetical protein